MKKQQENQNGWGGRRTGAGRKSVKVHEAREMFNNAFDEYFTEKEWRKVISSCADDPKMLKFLISQRIGRPTAHQRVEIDSLPDYDLNRLTNEELDQLYELQKKLTD